MFQFSRINYEWLPFSSEAHRVTNLIPPSHSVNPPPTFIRFGGRRVQILHDPLLPFRVFSEFYLPPVPTFQIEQSLASPPSPLFSSELKRQTRVPRANSRRPTLTTTSNKRKQDVQASHKKKHKANEEEISPQAIVEKRRAMNNLSAKNMRIRKKEQLNELHESVQEFAEKNKHLEGLVEKVQKENKHLEGLVEKTQIKNKYLEAVMEEVQKENKRLRNVIAEYEYDSQRYLI